MKKKLSKKLLWQSLLSIVILGGFICLAFESGLFELPDKDTKYNPETKAYTETRTVYEGEDLIRVRTGKQDDYGLWHGSNKIDMKRGDKYILGTTGNFVHGLPHGRFNTIYYRDGKPVKTESSCYFLGIGIKCDEEKSVPINQENPTSYEIFEFKYSFCLSVFAGSGIDEEAVKAYIDTIETRLFKLEFDKSEFDDKYDEVVGDMEYSSLDSVWQVHDNEAYYQGFYYLKFAEFRRAVVDAYRTGENNTYSTIKTTYPNYDYLETWIEYPHLKDSMFRIFCTDFDSLMVSNGPLDPEDPFFADSVDIRMLNSLVNLILDDESSSETSLLIKSKNLPEEINSLSSFRKVALPVLKQIKADSLSGFIATYVGYTLAPHFYEGDKIRQAVREAYNLQKGIITAPVIATEFFENLSSSSLELKGYVIEDGGADVTERGIAWADFYNPTIDDNIESGGNGLGEFTTTLDGLSPGTTYYARSFAQNSAGIAYGNCIEFTVGATDIAEINDPEVDFTVYPNPASQEINISFCLESEETVELLLVDIQGRIVYQNENEWMPAGDNQIKIDVSEFESGIYSCRLTNNKTVNIIKKLLIAH